MAKVRGCLPVVVQSLLHAPAGGCYHPAVAALQKLVRESPTGLADIHGVDYEEISLGATLLLLDILSEINHFQRTLFMRWVLESLVADLRR